MADITTKNHVDIRHLFGKGMVIMTSYIVSTIRPVFLL
jgi:hypothetical protein